MKNRRTFLRIVVAGAAAIFVFIWNKLTLQHIQTSRQKRFTFPFNKNKEITFSGDFIIVNREKTQVFSAHCTHLGCKIDKIEGDYFICPCHGSEYNMKGEVTKGPAYKNLTELKAQLSEDGKTITIEG